MLASLLTTERLRALSGYAFERGQQYWREGRVLACALDDGTLDGIVTGGIAYHVRVAARGGDIASSCTCPVKMDMCKHAVALSLAYLARRSDSGRLARSHEGFATRAELDAWVAEHRVGHVMHLSAERVYARLVVGEPRFQDWLRHALARLCMRDVASREAAVRHVGPRGAEVAEAAHALLLDDAKAVRDALDAERDIEPATELARQLVAMRRAIRAHAVPRRAEGRWEVEPRTPAIVWREADRVVRDYGTHAIVARLAPSNSELAIECTCKPGPARCTHALSLLDATLAVLADPARADESHALEAELLRPGWSRALEELARFDDEAAKPRVAIEVWWHLEHELGTFALTPIVKKQLKRGGLSSGLRVPVARLLDEYRDALVEADLRVAEQLAAWTPGAGRGTYPSRAFLALAGHPRVVGEHGPVQVARLALGFTALAVGDSIRLEPMLDGARVSPKLLAALLATFEPGEPLVIDEPENGRCLIVEVADEARRMWHVLDKHGDAFPPESHAQLLDRLARIEGRLPIAVPQVLKGKLLTVEPVTVVRLRLLPDITLELELFVRPGPGAPLFQPGSGPRDVMLMLHGERGYVRRTLDEETARARAAIAHLALPADDEGPPNCFRLRDTDAALAAVAALESPPAGLEVEWIEQRVSVTRAMAPAALRVSVERKRDWFGITGDLKIENGRVELAVLLDAARRQQRFVRVDEQRWVELSKTLRERLQAVADQTYAQRGQLELSPAAVPAIIALEAAGAKVTAAPAWESLGSKLASALSLKPKPPATLKATLRDYQVEGHAWLARIAAWGAGACLADDMGLGKTVQALALLLDRAKLGPALVLAPTSVAFNWVQEMKQFAPSLRPILLGEQADRASCLAKLRKHDVLIASYGLLVRDAALLAARPFATLVIDEAQALKNATTRRAKAARELDAGFRVALSGTPLENHLGELWSLFAIVFPGLLGSWDQFRDRYASPIERGKDPAAREALSRVLRPFLLRRTKAEVARELPSRTEIHVPVALSKEERGMYEDARLAAIAELGNKGSGLRDEQRRFQVLAALTRLRLLASHPKLYDPASSLPSSKLRRLIELVEELKAEGHRALVFSQFTSHLALVRAELQRAGFTHLYLDGSTPVAQRAKLIAEFQTGNADLFLISLKAGGTGINLTAADNVIHLDPWWNPAVEDQATDRAHRIGQTKPVTVYRLISHGTIEEQILAMHGDKRALFAGILDGTNVAARLGTKDLVALLSAPVPSAVDQ